MAALDQVAQRVRSHPLVEEWRYRPDAISPRRLELVLDDARYPDGVTDVRLDVRWFENADYSVHYVESRPDATWQCRWDRHPKPDAPSSHYHPPPDASEDVHPSELDATHYLDVVFSVLDRVEVRVRTLHEK